MTRVTRREFVIASMMVAAGAGVPGRGLLRATAHGTSAATEPEGEWRNKQSATHPKASFFAPLAPFCG